MGKNDAAPKVVTSQSIPAWKVKELEEKERRMRAHQERIEASRRKKAIATAVTGVEQVEDGKKKKRHRKKRLSEAQKRALKAQEIYGASDDAVDDAAEVFGLPASFASSKNERIEGNEVGAASIKSFRSVRQYMNRSGGFDKMLDESY